MAKKKNTIVAYRTPIDTRLRVNDGDLCAFIRELSDRGERTIQQQIVYMVKFAAAQMSAHDHEPMK